MEIRCIFILLLVNCYSLCTAQKVLQIEKAGSFKVQKIFIGQTIDYKLEGNDYFIEGVIEDLDIENQVIVLADRYVTLKDIVALRYPRSWPQGVSKSLLWFGVGWSFFAVVGTATDGESSTSYQWSDAVVSASSLTSSFLVSKISRYKKIKIGKRRRLRLLDINFSPPE